MLNSLSGRFLILTAIFVMLAEVLIFVPSIARFREDFLLTRLERAQIAALVLLVDEEVSPELQEELLRNAEVFNVVLLRNETRQLILSSPVPKPIAKTFDLRDPPAFVLIRDAMLRLVTPEPQIIRVIGQPVRMGGLLIEITLDTTSLRAAMIDYGLRILWLSLVISVTSAVLLFLAVRLTLVKPIKRVVSAMQTYAAAPEDVRRVLRPTATIKELREAEETLQSLQTQLTSALKQKEHLAQLGGAMAKVNHDLRNILTSAQLITDRIETSEDPTVQRLAPKLINSLTRAVHLCEATLAYGKAEEPGPTFARLHLADVVADVIESERLAVGEAEISFAEDVPNDLVVLADAEQLYRIIGNLVRNARQAIMNSCRAGEIRVSADETPAEWRIRIIDTGPGLPARAREHLFKPFQGGTTKGGSGLGLTIAAELVRGHGGTLVLEYSDNKGTIFRITLPKGNFGAAS